MLLLLEDLRGDSFDIPTKFDKLWVNNCKDFKTVPAHIQELNIRNCASFEFAPDTIKSLCVQNCPRYLPTHKQYKINNIRTIDNWLDELNETYEELTNIKVLQDEVVRLNKLINELESQLSSKYGSANSAIRSFKS